MQIKLTHNSVLRNRSQRGFSLIEALMAAGVMGLFTLACLTGIVFDIVAIRKAKEESIANDFLQHYIENVKALPFTSLTGGQPINTLFSGGTVNGVDTPSIIIPSNSTPVSVTNADYLTFHPDLLWISDRNAQLAVQMDQYSSNGVVHDIHMALTLTWNAPLSKGGVMQVEMDLLRDKDL